MIINYDIFYRRFGVRQTQQLLRPRFAHIQSFQLPRGAILHYAHGDPTKLGPVESDIAFRGIITEVQTNGDTKAKNISRAVWLANVLELQDPMGTPTRVNVNSGVLVRQFQQQHRRFRQVRQLESVINDTNSMLVYNYDMLTHMWRYPRNPFNAYYEWTNIERELWKNVNTAAHLTDRPQFIIRSMPKLLPALSSFQQAAKMTNPSRRILNLFNSPEHLFLLELWKWFGPNRETSMLSAIPRERLGRVNIVFQESGHWLVVNLGLLDSWRKPLDTELLPNEKIKPNLINPIRYQARVLRFFMSIMQLRTLVDPEVTAIADQVLDKEDITDAIKELSEQSKLEVHRVPSGPAKKDPLTGRTELNTVLQRATVMDPPDEPEDTPESVKEDETVEAEIDADLQAMEKITAAKLSDVPDVAVTAQPEVDVSAPTPVFKRLALDEAVMAVCNRHADEGLMSAAQYRHYQKVAATYKTMKAPDGVSTMEQFITIAPEILKIKESKSLPDIKTVPDKTMLKSSLLEFDERYIEEVMQRDIASSVMSIQNAGIAVTSYETEKVESILGPYNMYTVRVTPVEGASSTLRFKLPVVEADGTYMANGVKYRLRKQRGDVPIRKTAPNTVAMTSYYGKTFIRRSEKKVNDYGAWLTNAIMAKNLNELDRVVSIGHPNNVMDHLFKSPRLYSILASSFRSFLFHPMGMPQDLEHLMFDMSFDHTKREELFGKEALTMYEVDGSIVAGVGGIDKDYYILINKHDQLEIAHQGLRRPLPPIETLLGLDRSRAPVDFVIKIAGDNIPLGVVLAYEIGLDNLINLLKAQVRRVPAGRRLNLEPHEESIVFNDETIVINRNDKLSCMFLAGFNEYHRSIKRYNVHLFNQREVYLNVLESVGLGARWLREIDLFYQMFIDPITHDLLVEMHEPTDMRLLLLRAGEMLLHDDHPAEFDAAWMRIKGYERMAGAVYSEIVSCIRKHNGTPGKHRAQLDMHPYNIWTSIQTDPSQALVADINPIQNLREKEAVTYNGTGGRNSRTMTKHTREYHVNDMGTISGDTVDSGDVAINTYTSADPQFTSLRGLSRRFDFDQMGATPLLSTSALISVGADHDDPKRVNFIGIQQAHGVSCTGYHQMPVRTGYEQVIAQRTSDMYAAAAKEDGKVISVTATGVMVQYASGKKQGFEIGRRFGNAAGLVIPHSVVANVKLGQEFKRGHILTYNDNFFEKDILNPNNVIWKAGTLAKVVLMEVSETLEDSSAISQRLADKLTSAITKTVDIVVNFTQSVRRLVKAGDNVNSEDILCIIEDSVTNNAGLFDDESLETLRIVENQSPQAKVKGVVERVEVYYHGDKEDMSDSLRSIANAGDKQLADRLKSIGKTPLTGSVDEGFRIDGDPLPLDTLAIRVYITSHLSAGEGDKGVFANQMKTVFGKKFVGDYRTESGEAIDAIFGQKSIDDRVVHSPIMIGTTNVLLRVIGKKAYEAYKS